MTENIENIENVENTEQSGNPESSAPSGGKKGFHVFAVIVIVLFALVIAAPWVLMLTIGDNTASGEEGGLNEKRELTSFPTTFSNDYFDRFEKFFNDHSPVRNRMIAIKTNFSMQYESFYRKNITPKLTELLVKPVEPETPEPGATPTPEPTFDSSIFDDLFGNNDTPTPSPTPTPEPGSTEEAMTPSVSGGMETADPSAETPAPGETGDSTATAGQATENEPTPTPHTHSWNGGTVTVAASCRQEGTRLYQCTVCGAQKTETIARLEHSYRVVRTQNASAERYGYTLSRCDVCGSGNLSNIIPKTTSTERLVPQYAGAGMYGRYDWLFYNGDNSVGYYQGTNILSNAEMAGWRNTFESLKKVCDAKGIRLAIVVGPNKEQVYPEYMPYFQVATQEKRQDVFLKYMQANSSVNYIYPLSQMNTAKILYDVYYKQDTHWNAIGGFVAAMEVYRTLGMETTSILDIGVTEIQHSGGDLVAIMGAPSASYTNYGVSYKSEISANVEFLPGSTVGATELRRYTSNSPNGAKLVVLGDSFRHAMSDYFAKDFAKATIAHRNDFGNAAVQSALKELSSGDVLVLVAVERYDAQNVDMAATLAQFLR